jgi:nicotinate-nucleotide--dimethylbenzimidazole phosphoribosyltransferase
MTDELARLVERIGPLDDAAMEAARVELDRKTKPRGSLGRLEELAIRYAGIRGSARPDAPRAAIVVAVADHGYAEEGVSAYPQEVTRQMLANFVDGGAAVCVLARETRADLVVVDAGVKAPYEHASIAQLRFGAGTANGTRGPAMTRVEATAALLAGAEIAATLAAEGVDVVGLGEMGIGNTTAASALHAALLRLPARDVCGIGTGLDADGVRRKVDVVERALACNGPFDDPVGALASLGGFEIGVLAGVMLGAAAERRLVVLDGFITAAAALVAAGISPLTVEYAIASHRSPEPGHAHGLAALGLQPLLDLELRLGEGSGAALALPLLRSAVAVLREMSTFESAGVTDAGR